MNNNAKISFSVVIPLYNKKPHIEETLQSVLNQTYTGFEVIVVNDASTDGSREVVEKLSDIRIKIIDRDQPGSGGYAARNRGIQEAQYPYIAFLDADDRWDPVFLESMVDLIDSYPEAGFYSCGWIEEMENNQIIIDLHTQKYQSQGKHSIDLKAFLQRSSRSLGPVCSSVAVVEKKLMEIAGGFPIEGCRYGGDIDTWFRIMLAGNSLAINPSPLAVYNKTAINMVTKSRSLDIIEMCVKHTAEKIFKKESHPLTSSIKRFVNFYQILQVKKRGMAAVLSPVDFRHIYFEGNPWKYVQLFVFSLLPHWLQRLSIKCLNSFKQ